MQVPASVVLFVGGLILAFATGPRPIAWLGVAAVIASIPVGMSEQGER